MIPCQAKGTAVAALLRAAGWTLHAWGLFYFIYLFFNWVVIYHFELAENAAFVAGS